MSSKLSHLGVHAQYGPYRKVPMARRLVTSSMTSRDHDVILATSQYSKLSHSQTRNRINYLYGTLKHTLQWNIVFKNQLIRLRKTLGEHLARPHSPQKFRTFHALSNCQRLLCSVK